MSKNLLICVSGLTPQIVTETLFCLAVKKRVQIDEIYVLTTKRGRDVILGKDKHPATPKSPLKDEINELCEKYKIKKPVFEENDTHIIVAQEESIELPDVRSDQDNILFPNRVCEFIRRKTSEPDNTLYCSITGGRKSMSVHLANALSIFARENDKLLHVLTKEEHEFKDFYPKNKNQYEALEISHIPFVRLRSLLSQEVKFGKILNYSFDRIVDLTQKQLKVVTQSKILTLDIERREIKFGNDTVSLEPMEFLFYYLFIDMKIKGKNKISIHEIISVEISNLFLEYFDKYYPNHNIKDDSRIKWAGKGFSAEDFRQKRSKINSKIKKLIQDTDIAELFIINVEKKYSESKYLIIADKSKFKIVLP